MQADKTKIITPQTPSPPLLRADLKGGGQSTLAPAVSEPESLEIESVASSTSMAPNQSLYASSNQPPQALGLSAISGLGNVINSANSPRPSSQPPLDSNPKRFGWFRGWPMVIAALFLLVVGVGAGTYLVLRPASDEGPVNSVSSQDDSDIIDTKSSKIVLNLDTTVVGKLGIGTNPTGTANLQAAGDILSLGTLLANGGTSSLSNSGLKIDNVNVCTARGCLPIGGLVAGTVGPQGPKGDTGATGFQGLPGIAICPFGDCLSLQSSTPGTQETGNLNVSGVIIAGSFSGGGASLTGLNAGNVSSGTLADARLSGNVTLQGNTFNGASQLVQLTAGGILPVLSGANLTSLNGSNISSGTVADARLSGNVTLQGNTFNGASQLVQLTAGGILPVLSGANLTNLNGSNIASGTVADARLSANVTLQGNTFNGASQLVQLTAGGILPVLSGANLTNLNATNVASGTLDDVRLSANVTLQGNSFNGISQLVQLDASGFLPTLNGSALTSLNASNIASGTLSDSRLSSNVALLNGTGPQTFTGNNKFTGSLLQQISVDSATAFQIQNAAGSRLLTVDSIASEVEIGQPSSTTGKLMLFNSAGSGSITLQPANPGASAFTLTLPAENGTLCSTGSVCTGYAASGSGAFVDLQGSTPGTAQTGNFNITGTGIAATLQATTLDTASGVLLNLGSTNATGIYLAKDTTVKDGKKIYFEGLTGNFDQSNSSGTFKTGTGAVSLNGNTTVASSKSFTANGTALFKNATDSTTAFQIQNAAADQLLVADTTGGGNIRLRVLSSAYSDEFTADTADAKWSFVGPAGTSYSLTAVADELRISDTDATAVGWCWTTSVDCPRFVQTPPSGDFQAEAKIDTDPSVTTKALGLIFHKDTSNFIRYEFNGTAVSVHKVIGGVGTADVISSCAVASAPVYMRVTKATSLWTFYYSGDGIFWTTCGSATQALDLSVAGSKVGLHIVNNPASTFDGDFDYFHLDTTSPTILTVSGGSLFQNQSDSTTAFRVQNASGTNYIQIDTSGANLYLGNGGIASTVQIGNTTGAVAQTVNIGNNATASSTTNLTIGNLLSTSSTTIQGGTGASAIALTQGSGGTITIGSSSGASAVSLQCGTGTCGLANNATDHSTTVGSSTGTSLTTLQGGTGGVNLLSAANITLGASDTTGTLLVLDTKTGSGDPTGVNGGMYYNSNANAFRCYENSVWKNCTSFWTMITKSSDESITNDNVLSNDSALQFTAAANTNYQIRCQVFYDTSATADFQFSTAEPTSPTSVRFAAISSVGGGAASANFFDDTTGTGTYLMTHASFTIGSVQVAVDLLNGANSGTWAFKWSQNTSDGGSTTVKKGSYCEYGTF